MRQSLLLFVRANRRHFAELLLASLLVNVFALALPLFSMLVYDKAIGNEVHDTLWALAIGMGLLLAQELVLRTARVYMIEHAGARWDAFLDERLMRGVLAAPLSKSIGVADLVNKVREGRPHIVDLMKDGKIALVLNTTEGSRAIEDSSSIRRTALFGKSPYSTTLSGARAMVQAIGAINGAPKGLEVRPLQDYLRAEAPAALKTGT